MPAGRPRKKHEPDILPTKAAATRLDITPQRLQKMSKDGVIQAYVYDVDTQMLREKQAEEKRSGQTLYFYKSDLDTYAASDRHAGRKEAPVTDKRSEYNKQYYQTKTKTKREQEKS